MNIHRIVAVVALVLAVGPNRAAEPALSLASLLAEAEANAPALRAASARIAAAEARPAQAEALPDPMVSVALQNESFDDWTVGDTPMSNVTLSWSQEVPYPKKRALRAEVARAEAGVEIAGAQGIRAALLARVKTEYVELHRLHRVRGIVEETRVLFTLLRDAARARFEAGEAALEGTLGAGAEAARLDAELAALDGERSEVEARLAALLGRREQGTFGTATEAPVEAAFDAEALARSATADSTAVAILQATTRRDVARVEAAKRELKPDFSWSAGYAYRESLDPMAMGMFGVRLPLFNDKKQHQAVAEAEHALRAAQEDAASAEIEAAAGVREALARAAAAAARAQVIEQAVVPQARAALDAATAAYSSGRADFGTILDYARALLADAREIEDLRARRWTVLALLEPTVGQELILPAGDRP